jgi:hypothetical protein
MDTITITGESQKQLAISATAAQTEPLLGGLYDLWSTVDAHIKVGSVGSDVTSTNGYLLRAGVTLPALRISDDLRIGAIAASAGTLSYHKIA